MQKFTAVGTALVLAASVAGLAVTGGAAQATTDQRVQAASAQKVKLTSTKGGIKVSTTTIRPGNTLFKVYRGGSGGELEVLRLRPGYSLAQASQDFGAGIGQGNVAAIKRVDHNVVFYGGIDVPAKGVTKPNQWGVKIDKPGKYYVINIGNNSNAVARLTVRGTIHRGALPKPTGWVNAAGTVDANRWVTPATDPHSGWMRTTNNAEEPHFPVLNQVQESTTNQDVRDYIASNTQTPPTWALAGSTEAGIISPGHTMVWKYSVPKGKYIVMCFWPSKTNGMPHFAMGMFKLFHLN
jgi:hypothetical protein